ncbi:MAG TPA: DUF1326 domain-containing protein [Burkholderiales bacterium]|nr:DUF1326 domain-containing protein [Burkholderiales bacterium]
MAQSRWKISGEYMESCNCDYLCPCIFTNPQAPATHDQCTSLQVYRIERGSCGEVALDGLAFALVIRSGRVMSDGNWIFAGVIDAAAAPAQREALSAIVSGEAGGTPARIRDMLVSDFRGVAVKPIVFTADGLKRAASIPGVLEFAIEGVPSRRNNGEPFYLDNTAHPANGRLALARSGHTRLHGFGLELELAGKGNNGHYAPFSWSA